jgi:hypothetical protein
VRTRNESLEEEEEEEEEEDPSDHGQDAHKVIEELAQHQGHLNL